LFERVFLQSGTFALDRAEYLDDRMFSAISSFIGQARGAGGLDEARVAMSCGRYEGLIGWNREIARRFMVNGVRLRFDQSWTGHDWGAWADTLGGGLRYLYGVDKRTVGADKDWPLG
jgi:hypothetical protein